MLCFCRKFFLVPAVRLGNALSVFLEGGGKLSDAERAKLEAELGEVAALVV